MEGSEKSKTGAKGAIVARCGVCKGSGQVPKKPPFLANPKAPLTRADRLGTETCPKCKGAGVVGVG